MARILDNYDFDIHARPALEKYPWSDWCDGQIWELKRGIDWDEQRTARQFRHQIDSKLKIKGITFQSRCPDQDTIILKVDV